MGGGGGGPAYDGPTIPYKLLIRTGDEKHCGLTAPVYVRLFGLGGGGDNNNGPSLRGRGRSPRSIATERIMLQLAKKKRFEPGSTETFHIEAQDVGDLTQIEASFHHTK